MMNLIHDTESNYGLSRNYQELWSLIKTKSVVCFIDFAMNCRDIAHTITHLEPDGGLNYVDITVRGFSYITAWNEAEFKAQCEKLNLSFITPA